MLLDAYAYIKKPVWAKDFKTDMTNLYLANGKAAILSHVQGVAEVITDIAQAENLDRDACIIAAYCHDIAAIIRSADMLKYARKHNMDLDPAEEKYPYLLHQRLSALIAEEAFAVRDRKILDSISHHTTLKANPTKYEMALFVADKLAWDQEGTPPFHEEVKRGLTQSLYHASLAYIEYMFNNNLLLHPHKLLGEAQAWLKDILN